VAALPSWKYGACCHSARSGVVRYALFAVRAAYAPSTPVSAGGCNVPLLLSVPDPPMWQLAHVRSNPVRPRAAVATSKLPLEVAQRDRRGEDPSYARCDRRVKRGAEKLN
jgi:hypothetical protein